MYKILGRSVAVVALSLCALSSAVAAQRDLRIRVINNSSVAIIGLYASNTGQGKWNFDMLRGDVIPPHRSIVADVDDGSGTCAYDLLAVMKGGAKITRFSVNVCRLEEWEISD